MVALYVMHGKVHLFCGNFKNENEANRWYYKNKRSLLGSDGLAGEPVTVTLSRNHKRK